MRILLNAVTVDTTGSAILILRGISRNVQASGNFGGGTVQIQLSNDGINWFAATLNGVPLEITDETSYNIVWVGGGQYIRAVLTGSTAPSLTVKLL